MSKIKTTLWSMLLAIALPTMAFAQGPQVRPFQYKSTTVAAASLSTANTQIYAFEVTTGASSGYAIIIPGQTVSSNGTITPSKCYAVAANATVAYGWPSPPVGFGTGVTVEFSTTGCFTFTSSSTAFISMDTLP